ncbi:short coiled-coil protein-like [Grammomys surdaster]|uniref:short coiled-coil protein-like n=1 Tax=Grammomys surdaster TaxID=491861 RepID=UPI00109FE962|nr:short coiled-coil protein-like [Grammomys surdaster]
MDGLDTGKEEDSTFTSISLTDDTELSVSSKFHTLLQGCCSILIAFDIYRMESEALVLITDVVRLPTSLSKLLAKQKILSQDRFLGRVFSSAP